MTINLMDIIDEIKDKDYTAEELAEKFGIPMDLLKRILELAIQAKIFTVEEGYIKLGELRFTLLITSEIFIPSFLLRISSISLII
jgi:response regulator of citrate/malate metabolism